MREPDVRCGFDYGAGECRGQAIKLVAVHGHVRPLCLEHSVRCFAAHCRDGLDPDVRPLLRDPRIACLVIAAITGAVPHDRAAWATVQVLLHEAFAGDLAAVPIALDLIEQAGLHEPEAWPTVAGVEWPRARQGPLPQRALPRVPAR